MGKVLKLGLMGLDMKDTILRVKNMAKGISNGLMAAIILVSSKITILKAMENTTGWMGEDLLVNGKKTRCMVEECLLG